MRLMCAVRSLISRRRSRSPRRASSWAGSGHGQHAQHVARHADRPSAYATEVHRQCGHSWPGVRGDQPQCSPDQITQFSIPDAQRNPVQPKTVIAGFVAAHDRYRLGQSTFSARSLPNKQRHQPLAVIRHHSMARHPITVRAQKRHQPFLLTQFDRRKKRGTMLTGGCADGGCLHLSSPGVGCGNNKPTGLHAHRPMSSLPEGRGL